MLRGNGIRETSKPEVEVVELEKTRDEVQMELNSKRPLFMTLSSEQLAKPSGPMFLTKCAIF